MTPERPTDPGSGDIGGTEQVVAVFKDPTKVPPDGPSNSGVKTQRGLSRSVKKLLTLMIKSEIKESLSWLSSSSKI